MRKQIVLALVAVLVFGPYSSLAWAQTPQPAPTPTTESVEVGAKVGLTLTKTPSQAPAPANNSTPPKPAVAAAPAGNVSAPATPAPSTPGNLGKPSGEPAKPVAAAPAVQKPRPRLLTFTKIGVVAKTPEDMAKLILRCTDKVMPNDPWNISCGELVEEFNKLKNSEGNPRYEPVADHKELAEFFRLETRVVPCRTSATVSIAGARAGQVEYFNRTLGGGEECFGHVGTDTLVSSTKCDQFFEEEIPIFSDSSSMPNPMPSDSLLDQGKKMARDMADDLDSSSGISTKALVIGGVTVAVLGALLAFLLGKSQDTDVYQCVVIGNMRCPAR